MGWQNYSNCRRSTAPATAPRRCQPGNKWRSAKKRTESFIHSRFAIGSDGANDFLEVLLEPVFRGAGDPPDVVFVVERFAELVEVTDVVHAQPFAEIDLGHTGLHTLGDVGHRNTAGAMLDQRRFHGGMDFGNQFKIQTGLFLENAMRAAVGDGQQIHVHLGSEFPGFLDAHLSAALIGGVRAFDDVADFRLHADAQWPDNVDDFLRAANIFLQRLIGVINHYMRETGFDGAENRLWRLAVIQRDGHWNVRVGGEKFDQHARVIIAAVFKIRLVAGADQRRIKLLRRFDDGAPDVVAAAVVVERGDAKTFGRSHVADLFCIEKFHVFE